MYNMYVIRTKYAEAHLRHLMIMWLQDLYSGKLLKIYISQITNRKMIAV